LMICADTTTTMATMTSASIIVGFVYSDRYKFAPVMSCCHLNPADKLDDNAAKYYSCFSLIVSYEKHPLLFLQHSFTLIFEKLMLPQAILQVLQRLLTLSSIQHVPPCTLYHHSRF